MKTFIQKIQCLLFSTILFLFFGATAQPDGAALYQQYCAQCHGADLTGGNASSLINGIWQFGAENSYVTRNIKHGIPHLGMPSYERSMTDAEIRAVVQYIRAAEADKGVVKPPTPEMVETMDYFMEVETFADNLEVPWAIDFIDNNTALITERPGRIRVVKNGILQTEPVRNTPQVLNEGQGGLLDVAVDPDYVQNGWIYLAYSHALEKYEGERPPAMTRIVRGKIENNTWTSEELLFEAPAAALFSIPGDTFILLWATVAEASRHRILPCPTGKCIASTKTDVFLKTTLTCTMKRL